jgi:hypothetical protein
MTEEQIASAVEDCLERCRNSPAVLVCVAEFVLSLRDAHQWEPVEAHEVGRRVLRVLRGPPD